MSYVILAPILLNNSLIRSKYHGSILKVSSLLTGENCMNKLFILAFLLSSHAFAAKVDQVNIKMTSHPQILLQGSLEVKKSGLFGSKVASALISSDQLNKSLSFKTVDLGRIDFDLALTSTANLKDKSGHTIRLKGEFNFKDNQLKLDKIKIHNDLTVKAQCPQLLSHQLNGTTLTLDFSQFSNLSSCVGKDLETHLSSFNSPRNVSSDGINYFSLNDDVEMGREAAMQFVRENRTQILPEHHPMTVYLQEQMERIAEDSDMPFLKPKVWVINADVLNAFALPGGFIFVFRGLLEKSPNEAALMGILGHEWAHVTARHGTRGMSRSITTLTAAVATMIALQVWSEVTDDSVKKMILPLIGYGALAGAQLYVLHRGREQELEADKLGSQYALRAGYHPRGIGDIFEVFKAEAGRGGNFLESILSTHPEHDTRIALNHVQSSLLYPVRSNYVMQTRDFQVALDDLRFLPRTNKNQSMMIAQSFVKTMRDNDTNIILKRMKPIIESSMDRKTK